jgi:hypothetical protein
MSDKHKLDPASRGGGGRTPQPPARPGGSSSKPNTQPRSRASTPTGAGEATAVSPSPTVSAVAGAKSNGAARQPNTISINNNNRRYVSLSLSPPPHIATALLQDVVPAVLAHSTPRESPSVTSQRATTMAMQRLDSSSLPTTSGYASPNSRSRRWRSRSTMPPSARSSTKRDARP